MIGFDVDAAAIALIAAVIAHRRQAGKAGVEGRPMDGGERSAQALLASEVGMMIGGSTHFDSFNDVWR